MKLRSLLCDRSLLLRLAYKLMIDSFVDVIEDASSGEATLDAIKRLSPDLILLDLNLHGLNGLELLASISKNAPNAKILTVCETYFSTKHYHKLIRQNVSGICLKESNFDLISEALTAILNGSTFCDQDLCALVSQQNKSDIDLSPLEIDILIRLDLRNIDISEELALDLRKIEKLIGKLLSKLQVDTRIAASQKASELGFRLLPVFSRESESKEEIQEVTLAERKAIKMIAAWSKRAL